MHDLTSFEQRLAQRLEIELSASVRPFTPARIALDAMGARGRRDGILRRLGLGDRIGSPVFAQAQRIAVAGLLLLALAVAAVTVGMLLQQQHLPADPRLALVRQNGDLAFANPDGSDVVTIAGSTMLYPQTSVLWAPNGEHLVLRNGLRDMVVVDRAGRETFRPSLSGLSSEVAWSPDGQRLALLDGAFEERRGAATAVASLHVFVPDGTVDWVVPVPANFGFVSDRSKIAWSPDGRTIAVVAFDVSGVLDSYPTHVWVADLADRTFRQLTFGDDATDYDPAWSDDGELFIARWSPLETGIWRVDPTSGAMERLLRTGSSLCPDTTWFCDAESISPLFPAPNGTKIGFRDPFYGISLLDVGSGEVQRLLPDRTPVSGPFVWTEDGSLMFIQGAETQGEDFETPDLVVLDPESRLTRVLVPDVYGFDILDTRD